MKFGILRNSNDDYYQRWVISCQNLQVDYVIINIFESNWLEKVVDPTIDCFLLRPPCEIEREKILYDERVYIISKVLKRETYPSYNEVYFYENKKLLSYYLKANRIPHPDTHVFYDGDEANEFIGNADMPLVGKTSIGASSSGVQILFSQEQALKYVKKAFGRTGIRKRFGPNRVVGNPMKWTKKAIIDPRFFYTRLNRYIERTRDGQRGFVIFQEYIPHEFEWRAIKIGDSFFVYKKMKLKDMASGAKMAEFTTPPEEILDFIRHWGYKLKFTTMAFDIFEVEEGKYMVNELQTLFGHVQKYTLRVDNKIGRYLYLKDKWVFEEGDFGINESYNLRLKDAINQLNAEETTHISP